MALPGSGEINPEWRLYARSASDDKAGVMAILTAFDAAKSRGITPSVNLKFVFEGEEEAGSPHLGEIIDLHKQLLESDAWIICDGPVHQSGRKQVVFGVRGDQNVDNHHLWREAAFARFSRTPARRAHSQCHASSFPTSLKSCLWMSARSPS